MKNKLKIILSIFVTAIICISGTIFATYQYQASQVEYNGKSVESVLNELYSKKTDIDLLWKNPDCNIDFPSQNISLNLSNYTGIIILGRYAANPGEFKEINNYKYIEKNKKDVFETIYDVSGNDIAYRSILVTDTEVQIGTGYNYATNIVITNEGAIPTYIFGVR